MRFPGNCDHCDRTATSTAAWWDGGAPGLGQYHVRARCDYHLGDPAGSIPGRCWSCGHAITTKNYTWVRDHGAPWILNIHLDCPIPQPGWRGPRTCSRCCEPIAYGQRGTAHDQPQFDRTLYSHLECPR